LIRVGLLLADHVRPGYQVIGGDYPDYFATLLPQAELVVYDLAQAQFPDRAGECQGWIISGSRHSVYEQVPWVERLADLVRGLEAESAPLVGVCFGAQMIAYAMGGEVAAAPGGWTVGTHRVEVLSSEPFMAPSVASFRILYSNRDQILSLPARARLLGRAEAVPVSMLAVGDHVVGFQGHPEFTLAYASVLMEARRGTLIPDEVVGAGLAALEPPDTGLLAAWIANFLGLTAREPE
jgi:GMP synthase-like glutamine amidotransferase